MRTAICVFAFLGVTLLLACAERNEFPAEVPLPDGSWLAGVVTAEPFDVGIVHNSAIARMRPRAALPMGMSYDEYVLQLAKCFNRALEPYSPSRLVTVRECEQTVGLLVVEIQPYFDLTFQDPTRADPTVVLDRWLEIGLITETEFIEFRRVLDGKHFESASEEVRESQSVFEASGEYWSGTKTSPLEGDEEPPNKRTLVRAADVLGTILGGRFGRVSGGLAGFAASTFFDMGAQNGGASTGPNGITGYGCGWCTLQ